MQQKKLGHHANYILGKSYYQQENYGQSNKYLLAAAKEEPGNAEIPYLMAKSYVDMDNYKMAVQYYEQALAKDTSNAKWYYETAFIYFGVPDAKKSVQYFEKAISKGYHATNDDWENLANAYVAAGQTDKGLQLLKELLEKKPADMDLLWNVANASFKMKKYDDAIACWNKMRENDNANYEALYMIGLSFQKKGETAKGQQICDKAIEMDPSLKRFREKKEMPQGL
jgi:tetratricopeptide (TPR) repeat protein